MRQYVRVHICLSLHGRKEGRRTVIIRPWWCKHPLTDVNTKSDYPLVCYPTTFIPSAYMYVHVVPLLHGRLPPRPLTAHEKCTLTLCVAGNRYKWRWCTYLLRNILFSCIEIFNLFVNFVRTEKSCVIIVFCCPCVDRLLGYLQMCVYIYVCVYVPVLTNL